MSKQYFPDVGASRKARKYWGYLYSHFYAFDQAQARNKIQTRLDSPTKKD